MGNLSLRWTFAEQVPGLTRRHSRWTERLRSALAEVGLALAGRAGARIADDFGISVSRSTVLRVLGVDEYAMRKGRVYGTVLVDVETGRPVDLLPNRESADGHTPAHTSDGQQVDPHSSGCPPGD
ncbi:hypothetical protein ACFYN0_11595 [Streptomyces sp. NPDC006704]|uniref:hypothetical protein n=1 Tax=Streptomyces sp. NPDC006704 TaxID=3364760 RepID=UPI003693C27B